MKKIGVFYFSGTGNTKVLAEHFVKEFEKRGSLVSLFALDDVLKQKISIETANYNLIGLLYPIHAFNASDIVFQFIQYLPMSQGVPAFVIKSPGDCFWRGGATTMVRKRLVQKGIEVFYEQYIVMPPNIFIRYDDALIKQLALAAFEKAARITEEVLAGTHRLEPNPLWLQFLTWAFSRLETQGARWTGRWFQASDACIQCDRCVKGCPVQNISREGKQIRFDSRCLFCFRCLYACPQQAISPFWAFRFAMLKNWYHLPAILQNPDIKGQYMNEHTQGYFRRLYEYMQEK